MQADWTYERMSMNIPYDANVGILKKTFLRLSLAELHWQLTDYRTACTSVKLIPK